MKAAPPRSVVAHRGRTGFAREVRLSRASGPVRRLRLPSFRRAVACVITVALWLAFGASVEDARADEMRSLDEQVQEVKSDVLEIAAELSNLEEKLLFPSGTQLAVFVSLTGKGGLDLDSTEIRIDGERVAAHVYNFKEVDALRRGGIQRIHTGNVTTGTHRLEVVVTGRTGSGGEVERTKAFEFEKGVGPKLLEISLATDSSGDGLIALGQP